MRRLASGYELVEAPVWRPGKGLLFSDAVGGGVHWLAEDGSVSTVVGHRRGIGGMGLHVDGGVVVSGRNLAHKNLKDGVTSVILDSEILSGAVGFNDLTTDRAGRVYVGSLGFYPTRDDQQAESGSLYLIDVDGAVRELWDGIKLTNGLGVSPDGTLLYHSDSLAQTVYVYDLDSDGGAHRRRAFAILDDGRPDGLAVSVDGAVWVAAAYDSAVLVFEPDGRLRRRLQVPQPMVTSLCFGGEDLRDLYVVTGSDGGPAGSGSVYCTRVEIDGLPLAAARIPRPAGGRDARASSSGGSQVNQAGDEKPKGRG